MAVDPDRAISTLKHLIEIPNAQPDMDEVRRFIETAVHPNLPLDAFDEVLKDAWGNLAGRLKGSSSAPPLYLIGYGGSFPPETMRDPYLPKEVDGAPYGQAGACLWGRGTCEQKGALASALEAIRSFSERERKREVVFLVTVAGETGSHEAVSHFFEETGLPPGDAIIVMGTGNEVCRGNKGRVDVRVTLKGRACHSSTPALGLSPFATLGKCLERLSQVPLPPADPHLGPVTLVPTTVESFPRAKHTIPERIELMLDRRLLPGEEPGPAVSAIETTLGDLSPVGLEVRGEKFQYANKVRGDSPLAKAAEEAVRKVKGGSNPFYMNAALDAGYFFVRGHDAICLGPGDMRLAHTEAEMVSLKDVIEGARIFFETLAALCQ